MQRIARSDVLADVHFGDDVFEFTVTKHAHVDMLHGDQLFSFVATGRSGA